MPASTISSRSPTTTSSSSSGSGTSSPCAPSIGRCSTTTSSCKPNSTPTPKGAGGSSSRDLPFERLVEVLNPTRSLARHPLFQVCLVIENAAGLPLTLPGLEIAPEPGSSGVARFDLSFGLKEQQADNGAPAGLAGAVLYATDLFDRATVETLAARFVRLLRGIVATPDTCVGDLAILDAPERDRILVAWNDTEHASPDAVRPPADRGPGRADAEGPGGGRRGPHPLLRRARRPGQPAGPPADRPRRGPGAGGRADAAALGGAGGRHARRAAGRRGLPAGGPRLPGRPHRLPARRRRPALVLTTAPCDACRTARGPARRHGRRWRGRRRDRPARRGASPRTPPPTSSTRPARPAAQGRRRRARARSSTTSPAQRGPYPGGPGAGAAALVDLASTSR